MRIKYGDRIALLITAGNALILALLVAIGWAVNTNMHRLAAFSAALYEHPFTVTSAALTARSDVEEMRDHMLEIALSRNPGRIRRLAAEVAPLDTSARNNIRIVQASFLGDPEKVKEVQRLLDEWRELRARVIGLAEHGETDAAQRLVMTAGTGIYSRLNSNLGYVIDFARNRAAQFVTEARRSTETSVRRVLWLQIAFALAIVTIGLETARRAASLIRAEETAVAETRRSERNYRSLFDNMQEGLVHARMFYESGKPHDFLFIDVNPAFGRLTGFKDVIGKKNSEINAGLRESNPALFELLGRVALNGKPEQFESHVQALGKWFSVSAYSTEREHFVAVFGDITKRKDYEKQLRLTAALYAASSEAMVITDAATNIISINPAFTQITGYGPDEVLGRNPLEFCAEHRRDPFYPEMLHALASQGHWTGEVWDKKKNGEAYAVRLSISAFQDENGSGPRYVAQFADITEKKRMDEITSTQASFDSLTGLPNRRLFREHLEHEIRKAHRTQHKLALMFIDLDRFKQVNDTLGHQVGDKLLVAAARRIVACVRESDIVSRLGGDEFTVILSEVMDVNRIEHVAHAIIHALAQPYNLGEEAAAPSGSMGIAVYPADAASAEDLIRNADQAMYLSKSAGRNRFHFFTEAMQEAARRQHELAQDLRSALSQNQLQLHFQPIVDLSTGAIFKAEALLRWQHPLHGMIGPAEFIPVAEDTGLIDELSDWVFDQALEHARRWAKSAGHPFRIDVNISPVQFVAKSARSKWIGHLRELSLSGKSVSIEINERTLLNDRPEVVESLHAVHALGMEVAIDDFATGQSSLSSLQKFQIDYLKIDQSFIGRLAPGSAELALSEAIIVMAHKLGMKVIAEGIETAAQRDLLVEAGCDLGQGYFFSHPLPAEEFEKLLPRPGGAGETAGKGPGRA